MSDQSTHYVKLTSELANDPEMAELVEMFVSELPERLKELETVWGENRYDDLKRISHQLKGASGGYGFQVIGAAAGKLEGTLKGVRGTPDIKTLESMKTQFDDLVRLCRRAAA